LILFLRFLRLVLGVVVLLDPKHLPRKNIPFRTKVACTFTPNWS
jgi:hypothetical protein